jgi:hypothetical protein
VRLQRKEYAGLLKSKNASASFNAEKGDAIEAYRQVRRADRGQDHLLDDIVK